MLTIDETAELQERLKKLHKAAEAAIGPAFHAAVRLPDTGIGLPWAVHIEFRSPGGQIRLAPEAVLEYGADPLAAIEAGFAEVRRRFIESEARRDEARAALNINTQGAA